MTSQALPYRTDMIDRLGVDELMLPTQRLVPAGPISQEFCTDPNLYSFIMGPVGSGKTTTLIIKLIIMALAMPPCLDGVRRIKIRVLRESYTSLYSTFLDTWLRFFRKDMAGSTFEGGSGRPITHIVRGVVQGRERMPFEMDVEMLGIGAHRVQEIMRGWEGTIVVLNEADQMHIDVMDSALERTGRYPPVYKPSPGQKEFPRVPMLPPGKTPLRQVIGDFNPPDIDHPLYERFVGKPSPAYKLFRLPSGLAPNAENIQNLALGRKYYLDLVASKDEQYVRRMVHGEFGYSRHGQPVFPEFRENKNVSELPLEPSPGLEVFIGIDASGLSPAAVFVQPQINGQFWITDEVCPPVGCGAARFAEYLRDMILARYRYCKIRLAWGDPSNAYGADREDGQMHALEIISKALQIHVRPAWTNEINTRLGYVREMIIGTIDGDNRKLIVSRHCKITVAAFIARYVLQRVITGATEKLQDKPSKDHPHSDVMDAVQYVFLGLRGRNDALIDMTHDADPSGTRRRMQAPARARIGNIRV